MLITGLIPARYASTRFPGKPLALIGDKPMIQYVYEKAIRAIDMVFVVTDDSRIADEVRKFGGNVIMTSTEHPSGTDRCAEAIEIIKREYSVSPEAVINIQGDEPFIKPEQIEMLCHAFDDESVNIVTLAKKIPGEEGVDDPNRVKVVFNKIGDALYFSRSPIPYKRNRETGDNSIWFKHLGIYGYRTKTLMQISKLDQTDLEKAELLEQLRWLDNGFNIRILETEYDSFGIDTPADLERAGKLLKQS